MGSVESASVQMASGQTESVQKVSAQMASVQRESVQSVQSVLVQEEQFQQALAV